MLKNIKRSKDEKELLRQKISKLGRTFCSKLLIKLTSNIIIPDLYIYILKYEYANRTQDDIDKILPKLMNLIPLNEYLKYNENKKNNNYNKIIKELAKISFYQKTKKFEIIKKANENINKFFFVLNGSIWKLNLIFKKEKISIEEYLVYIIKMNILQEKQIVNKCNILNKNYINLDLDNIESFFEENKEYNYKQIRNRAINELILEKFKISKNKIEIGSLENYMNIGKFKNKDRNDTCDRFYLFIGQYIKIKCLEKGDFIGDLSLNEINEGYTYICENTSNISYINKLDIKKSDIYYYITEKYKNIFNLNKKKFYIFKDILDKPESYFEKYIYPYIIYKKYKKGENIIIQNSQHEGIYFILDGKINIRIYQKFNELSNILVSLQYSIFNFKDYVSQIIKTVDILNQFHLKYMLKPHQESMIDLGIDKIKIDILSSNEYLNYFKGIKKIEFYDMGIGDILGMNELFDYKTELYNFTATCITEETNLFFLPKKYFYNIIEKEGNIMNNIIQLIDLKAKILIGKINSFRMKYNKNVLNIIKNKRNNNNENIKNNIFYISSISNNIKKLKKIKYKTRNNNNVKLFKNNSLLTYLKNKKLVRINSLSDTFNINIHEVLSNRLKNYLSPQFSKNNNYINFSQRNRNINEKNLKYNYSYINNNIIYQKNIKPLGEGNNLLLNVNENQKKFDKFQKEKMSNIEFNKILPILKNKKKERNNKYNIKKKLGKTMSMEDINNRKLKIFEN